MNSPYVTGHAPRQPAGTVGALLNRMLVHTSAEHVPALRPYVSAECGGYVLTGSKAPEFLRTFDHDGVALLDPAAYEKHSATPDDPFLLPEGGLFRIDLPDMVDQQLSIGATAALTPTKFISAGDIDSLKAAAQRVAALARQDVIFVAPLDVSLLGSAHIRDVTAILADAGSPVALVLGRRFGALAQTAHRAVVNPRHLRTLVDAVDLMPIRTDLTAFDLVAHGAFAGAIRHGSTRRSGAPDVLVPEFMTWWNGGDLAELFGARESLAPRCPCEVCDEQRLTRLIRSHHADEAMCHAVATWSGYAADMLGQQTLRQRAQYWRNLCRNAVLYHAEFTTRLRRVRPLVPCKAIHAWARMAC